MQIQVFFPHPALRPFIRIYVVMQLDFPLAGTPQHITPKREPAIFFPFGKPFSSKNLIVGANIKSDLGDSFDQPFLVGQGKIFGLFNWSGHCDLCIVALHPHALHHFLQDTAGAMTGHFYSFDLIGKSVFFRDLQEKLWQIDAPATVVKLIEKYLLKYFLKETKNLKPTDTLPLTNWINHSKGLLTVNDLSKKFQVSPRRLQQQFSTEIGLTPKEFIRIVRFREVAKKMYTNPKTSWLDLVAEFNYSDHSHLVRDFQQFAGVSPTVLSEELPIFDQMAYSHAF